MNKKLAWPSALLLGGLMITVVDRPPAEGAPAPRRQAPETRSRATERSDGVAGPSLAEVRKRYAFFKDGRPIWGNGVGRKIALTFDDGPHYQTTPRLLDHLDAFGVKATFFVNSKRFNPYGLISSKSYAVIREAHRRGHLIGNHTYAHPNLQAIPADKQRRQIERTDKDIQDIIGVPSYLFRPPYGALSHYAKKLLKKRGSTVVMWNLGSDDDKHFNVSKVVNTLMRKLERMGGGVVLLHDTHYWSVEAVPPLLQAIRIESCRQLALGEEPYEVVGLEYFQRPRGQAEAHRSPAAKRAWLKKRAALVKRCQTQPKIPVPAFIRGE